MIEFKRRKRSGKLKSNLPVNELYLLNTILLGVDDKSGPVKFSDFEASEYKRSKNQSRNDKPSN